MKRRRFTKPAPSGSAYFSSAYFSEETDRPTVADTAVQTVPHPRMLGDRIPWHIADGEVRSANDRPHHRGDTPVLQPWIIEASVRAPCDASVD